MNVSVRELERKRSRWKRKVSYASEWLRIVIPRVVEFWMRLRNTHSTMTSIVTTLSRWAGRDDKKGIKRLFGCKGWKLNSTHLETSLESTLCTLLCSPVRRLLDMLKGPLQGWVVNYKKQYHHEMHHITRDWRLLSLEHVFFCIVPHVSLTDRWCWPCLCVQSFPPCAGSHPDVQTCRMKTHTKRQSIEKRCKKTEWMFVSLTCER